MPKVAIIGSGPTGLMCALKLVECGMTNITIFEKGEDRYGKSEYNITEGIGGAGSYSDSKFNLTNLVGGTFSDFIGKKDYDELLKMAMGYWGDFAQTEEDKWLGQGYSPEPQAISLAEEAKEHDLQLDLYDTWHFGTENMQEIVHQMHRYLEDQGVTFVANNQIDADMLSWILPLSQKNKNFDYVVVAVGRSGGHFIKSIIPPDLLENNGVDIGIRLECDNLVSKKFLDAGIYEPKLRYLTPSFSDRVRTFCWCPGGFVALEEYRDSGIKTANGHSYSDRKSPNTNFAILVNQNFTEPFHDPQGYAEDICSLANHLAGGQSVLVQRLGDIFDCRRSISDRIKPNKIVPTLESAVAGDISLAMPSRLWLDIMETLYALNEFIPGVADRDTLLYGMECKFYNTKVKMAPNGEVLPNLWVGGDCSGYTRGLNQASVMGLWVASQILEKL